MFLVWLALASSPINPAAADPANTLQTCRGSESDYIALVRVEDEEIRKLRSEPDQAIGWLYRVISLERPSTKANPQAATVLTRGMTARRVLDVGKIYLLHASLDDWGMLKIDDPTFEVDDETLARFEGGELDLCTLQALNRIDPPLS
jgi:hypothetical protein